MENSNKKWFGILAVIIVALGLFVYIYYFKGAVYAMDYGTITYVEDNVVTVRGSVGGEERIITFTITPDTLFEKNALILLPPAEVAPGEFYTPESKVVPGSARDLKSGGRVMGLQSDKNLLRFNKAKVISIKYAAYDFSQTR